LEDHLLVLVQEELDSFFSLLDLGVAAADLVRKAGFIGEERNQFKELLTIAQDDTTREMIDGTDEDEEIQPSLELVASVHQVIVAHDIVACNDSLLCDTYIGICSLCLENMMCVFAGA
jgi:hypothetical protein